MPCPSHEATRRNIKDTGRTQTSCSLPIRLFGIEKILPPLVVAAAQQPHQMTTRVKAERTGRPEQFHSGLVWRAAPLAVVARVTAGNQVLPGCFARTRPGNHMVQSHFPGWQRLVAILTGV